VIAGIGKGKRLPLIHGDDADRMPEMRRSGHTGQEQWKMLTPRHSGNRGIGNLLEVPAALVNPLIPFGRSSKIAQKYSQPGSLPCVIFLKVAGWLETDPSKKREKATQ